MLPEYLICRLVVSVLDPILASSIGIGPFLTLHKDLGHLLGIGWGFLGLESDLGALGLLFLLGLLGDWGARGSDSLAFFGRRG